MARLFPALPALLMAGAAAAQAPAPLLREFMGVNGHTVQFRPALYKSAVLQVRDYHPMDWDTGNPPVVPPPFPLARNGVDWHAVYGSWRNEGFTTDACLMFDMLMPDTWPDPGPAARAYGETFARAFGPSSATPLVASAEVGNEPGKHDDARYRAVFTAMARGLRAGDPRLMILPCALTTSRSGEYARSVACLEGLDDLYDALNIHDYAQAEGWPTWRRSYPEDPAIPYLNDVRDLLAWRDAHAAGKPVWVTEFGWDCSTKKMPPGNEESKWIGVTDLQQAQYLVRSFLVFARLGVGKAFIYFFNDEDHPGLHAGAGLTRNWVPKPSYWAVGHLLRTLGDCRFDRVVAEVPGKVYAYRFVHRDGPAQVAIAVWSPTGSGLRGHLDLDLEGYTVAGLTKMATGEKEARLPRPVANHGHVHLRYDESPVYLLLKK